MSVTSCDISQWWISCTEQSSTFSVLPRQCLRSAMTEASSEAIFILPRSVVSESGDGDVGKQKRLASDCM
jgi:hypothetical protein